MNWLASNLNLQMSVLFLAFAWLLLLAMKMCALFFRKGSGAVSPPFWLTPLPAFSSQRRWRPRRELLGRLLQGVLLAAAVATGYHVHWDYVVPLEPSPWVLGYLAAPVMLLMSLLFSRLMSLPWLPSGRLLPALHNSPPLACGIADFWGRRWNLWFSDWFRDVPWALLRSKPVRAVFAVFLVSGVMHEWAINLPLYLVTGRRLFGTMMLYFLLQAAGLLLERRWLARRTVAKVILTWLVVLGPAPLLLNESMLRILRLWPY